MREIRVTGKGKLTVVPDRMIIHIVLKGLEKDYKNAVENSKKSSREIRDVFTNLGFSNKDIKTSKYEIEAKHERECDRRNRWQTIFKGYEYIHIIKVEFDKDNELLAKIIRAITNCKAKPEWNIQYTVSDVEQAKNELLNKAVQDSKKKAQILADASGVVLKQIVQIDYSWKEMRITAGLIGCGALEDDCDDFYDDDYDEDFSMEIEPEDIKITDTVAVVWEIEG